MGGINHQTWVVYYCYTHIRLSRSLDLSLDRSHPARPAWNCGGPGHSRPRNREVARKMLSPPPVSVTTVAKRTPSQAPCSSGKKKYLGMFQVPATQLTSQTSCCTIVYLALGLKLSILQFCWSKRSQTSFWTSFMSQGGIAHRNILFQSYRSG